MFAVASNARSNLADRSAASSNPTLTLIRWASTPSEAAYKALVLCLWVPESLASPSQAPRSVQAAYMVSYGCVNHAQNGYPNPTHLKVKFVPRLGPFAVSSTSKKVMASAVEWNVIDNRPP